MLYSDLDHGIEFKCDPIYEQVTEITLHPKLKRDPIDFPFGLHFELTANDIIHKFGVPPVIKGGTEKRVEEQNDEDRASVNTDYELEIMMKKKENERHISIHSQLETERSVRSQHSAKKSHNSN